MFLIISNQILKMLLLLLLGVLCCRLKIIDHDGNKVLTELLLTIVNPFVAIMALQKDYEPHLVSGLMISFAAALLTQLTIILIARLLFHRAGRPDSCIEQVSSIYSNCGFMGIPLVQSILGSEGVFYLTAYIIAFNLLAWTHGIVLMSGKTTLRDMRKGLLSPMIVSCVLAIVLFLLKIRIPTVLADAITYVSSMNTPLAMLIAGISVAQTNLLPTLKNKRIYFVAAVKLLLMPALVLAAFVFIRLEPTVMYTILVAAACPSAATGTAFAIRFRKNDTYASELYAFTTICSLVTIPLFVYAAERLLV